MRGDRKFAPLAEWFFWTILVAILWSQTARFSQPIANFRFGADGWPRVVLLCLWFGATFQLAVSLWSAGQGDKPANKKGKAKEKDKAKNRAKGMAEGMAEGMARFRLSFSALVFSKQNWRIAGIFLVPLLYLWFMRRMGFFVLTPFFVLLYLWVLDVRRWRYLITVSFSIYALVLLIFTRLFYIALPVGSWHWFYEVNNHIITLVRLGL